MKFDREEALDWIMNEIWRNGIDNFSVNAASENLGITRSSFYNAFGNKESAILEALDRYASISPYTKLVQFSGSEDPLTHLSQVILEICSFLSNDPEHRGCLMANCSSELIRRNCDLGPLLEGKMHNGASAIIEVLNRAKAKGDLAEDADTNALSLQLQTFMQGLSSMSKLHSEEDLLIATKAFLRALQLYRKV